MWEQKTTKEKLDLVFVCVGILTFSLTAILHIRTLRKHIKDKQNEKDKENENQKI